MLHRSLLGNILRAPSSLQVHRAKDERSGKFPNFLVQDSTIEPTLHLVFIVSIFEDYHTQAITNGFGSGGHSLHCPARGFFPAHSDTAIK